MLLISVFLLIPALHKASPSISCYSCSAGDIIRCNAKQMGKPCGQYDDQCFTLSYSFTQNVSKTSTLSVEGTKKGCASTHIGCETYCTVLGFQNCEVSCCQGNYCNKKEKSRNKRRLENSSFIHHLNSKLLLFSLIIHFINTVIL